MTDFANSPMTGFSSMQPALPPVTPRWVESEERLKREDATTTGDYLGAMWRQDGLVDGLIAHVVGSQMKPDPNYSPYDEGEWKELTDGVWPEFHKEFGVAHSAGHARYLKDRLLQKQADLTKLGDLGVAGTIGRIALSVLSPENLAMGYVGGVATRGLRLAQVARATQKAETLVGQAAARAGAVAEVTAAAGKPTAVAAGVAVGAAENAAFEALRQSVNFEDDDTAVLEAALIGAGFTTPFALAGARAETRVAKAAKQEHEALKVLSKVNDGAPLTPEEGKLLAKVVKSHETVRDVELGRITPEEAFERIYGSQLQGPQMPLEVWMERYGESLRERGKAVLDEVFPQRVTERTKEQFLAGTQPLRLGYDPTAKDGPIEPLVVGKNGQAYKADMTPPDVEAALAEMAKKRFKNRPKDAAAWVKAQMDGLFGPAPQKADAPDAPAPLLRLGYDPEAGKPVMMVGANGQAFPAMGKADLEEMIQGLAAKKFPKDPEKAERWAMTQRAGLLGYTSQRATKIKQAKAEKAKPKDPVEVLTGDKPQRAPKLESPVGQKPAKDMTPEELQAERNKLVPFMESYMFPNRVPEKGTPEFKLWEQAAARVEELQAAAKEKGLGELLYPTAEEKAAAGPIIGRAYDFRNKNGETLWGELVEVREDGWWVLKDEDNKTYPVHPSRIVENQEPPSGFLRGSVGAAQVAEVEDVVRESTAMRKLRLDYFSILDRSESQGVRDLAFQLIKDPIQSNMAQGMTASEWKSHLRRTIGGVFHVEARAAAREAADKMKVPFWGRANFYHEFHSMVSRLTRGDLSVTMVNKDIAPMLQRASAAQKEVYRRLLEEAKAVGVKGVEDVDFNEFYVNRVWNHKGIQAAIDKHGAEAVHKLLATAINVPGYIGDTAKAARFLDTVRRLEFSKVMQNVHLYAQDMGTLRGLLAKEGLDEQSINDVVDLMFTAKEKDGADTGRAGNLKYRFDINETLSANTPAGVLRISDLFENDARVLVDSYLNTMGGHIAMAKKGFTSEAEFQAALKELQDDALAKGTRGVAKDLDYLQDIYANIVGRPMSTQEFSGTARVAAAFRGYTRSVMLGQLGLTAAFEMKQAVGLMGFRAFYTQLPAFRGFIDAVRNGFLPDNQLAKDVMHMTGFGTEMSAGYARAAEVDEGFLGQTLSRVEHVANMASHTTDLISGNASFTSLTRQFSSMMAIQRVFDFASGKVTGKFMENFRERAVGWGVDKEHLDGLLESLKTYTVANKGGKVESIQWEKWLQENPQHYQQFQTLISRMVRDAIQDQDLGEMLPFMHQTLGKLFGELKTFFMVAHAKNMLKNLHYRDATAFQVWSIAFIGEMLAYTTQTGLNYAHDPAKREELLTPEKIATAAFVRSPVHGMLPFFAETSFQIATGGRSLIGPDMTANTGNRSLLITPSMMAVQRLWAAPSTATGLLLNQGTVSEAEGLNLWKTLPLSNMIGARNLGAILMESLPERELTSD